MVRTRSKLSYQWHDNQKRTRLEVNTKIKTGERVRRLVKVIGKGSIPRRELIADLGLHQDARRNFRDNYLKPAIARGLVIMQYPDVPSRPEQAYRLTADGLDFLEKLRAEEESKKDQAGN